MSDEKEIPKEPELTDEALSQVAGGAGDFLLKIEGIKGESQDDKHENELE